MLRIFDNIEQRLLPALRQAIDLSDRSDFCVGSFNLRGWKQIVCNIERWSGGEGHCCRLLIGMQRLPQDDLREALSLSHSSNGLDPQTAARLKKRMAEEFRDQLTFGAPTNEDEEGLRNLAAQIRAKKVVVNLFFRHPLHAKLESNHTLRFWSIIGANTSALEKARAWPKDNGQVLEQEL